MFIVLYWNLIYDTDAKFRLSLILNLLLYIEKQQKMAIRLYLSLTLETSPLHTEQKILQINDTVDLQNCL